MIEVGIMGGTFNPPHTRQLMVAQCALDQYRLAKVIFVPNGSPPHKKVDVLDKDARFAMVQAAVSDNPAFQASRIEVDRPGITWTIDTLKEFKKLFGEGVRLNFIIGEDNIKTLAGYDRRDELFALCRLLVSPRDYVKRGMVKRWRKALPGAELEAIACPADARSSTLIRQWIREGKSVRYMVPPAVYALLTARGHYKDVPATEPPATSPAQATAKTEPVPKTPVETTGTTAPTGPVKTKCKAPSGCKCRAPAKRKGKAA